MITPPSLRPRLPVSRRSVLTGALSLTAAALLPRQARAQANIGVLRVVQPFEMRSLDPAASGSAYVRCGLAETLIQSEPDGRIVPGLAESWTVSPDRLDWQFVLRRGVVFHDGTPVTAQAVKQSFDRLLAKTTYLRSAGITSVTAGEGTVGFLLAKPFSPFLAYLVDNTCPVLAPSSFNAAGEVVSIVSTGPFKLAGTDLPRAIELARSDAYWGQKPVFRQARYEGIGNGETRANIAVAGDADLVFNIPPTSVARVEGAGLMRVDRTIIPRVHMIVVNCAKPQFADVRVRQALSLAIDRRGIATSIMRNPQLAATQYLPPVLAAWHFDDLDPLRNDTTAANRLLDEAGWTRGPDGIRSRNGVRLSGLLRTFVARPELPTIAQALQSQFKAIGFEVSISVGETSAITEGQLDGSLDLALSSRTVVFAPDPISTLTTDFASDEIPRNAAGATGWKSAELRGAVATYVETGDEQTRQGARRTISTVLQRELPVIPVVWYDQLIAVAKRIDGFVSDPFEQRWLLHRLSVRS